MTRDEILGIVTDDEMADALWRLFEGERMELQAALERAVAENGQLREAVADYQAEKEQHTQAAAEERARQALEKRFDAAVGNRQFVHELVRQGVMADFRAMIEDPANEGRGDKELLEELTRDQGCFAKQCPPAVMAKIGDVPAADVDRLSDAEYYASVRMKGMR